jgi:hypothetical protein
MMRHSMQRHALSNWRLPAGAFALVVLAVGAVSSVSAHGGGTPQLLNQPSGPYLISVWTDPEPLRTDESHFNVALLDPDTREPILAGVDIRVELAPPGGGPLLAGQATTEQSTNKTVFVAVFEDLPAEGVYEVTVTPSGPAGPGEPVAFSVSILPPAPFNWLGVVLAAGGTILLGVVVWLWAKRSADKAAPRRRPTARPAPPPRGRDRGEDPPASPDAESLH